MFNFIADKLNVKNLGEMLAPTYTPEQELHASIEEGLQDKFFRLLDEQQVSPHCPNAGGNLPIHTASYYGRIAMIESLISRGIDVNTLGPRDNTPLHFASSQGHFETVKFLINNGANPAKRNRNGKTPYDIAKGDSIRQFLLPLQFRHEDPNEAKSMLPPGITPSIDPLAPRPDIAPPPLAGAIYNPTSPAPPQAPFNPLYAAPTHSAIPRGPAATRITRGEYRPIQADGFGTSVGNEELTAKYGNTREVKVTAPPPVLGGAPGPAPVPAAGPPAAPSEGANPYSAMGRSAPSPSAPYARGPYPGFAPGGATPPQSAGGAAPRGPPQFKIFNPKAVATNTTAPAATPVPGAYPGAPAPSGSPYGAAPAFGTAPAAAAAGGAATAPGGFETVPMDAEEVTLSASASVLQ
ncbi:hypothetical protein ATCC90586_008886 [Pythium insidiosum]|nr:hypothetical protein ATCC90586_008886 [Pythium insidiosum]